MVRLIAPVVVFSVVVVAAGGLAAQPIPLGSPGSHQYLSARGAELAGGGGLYNSLTVTQRATFEAIIHALESEGIDDLIEGVTRVWGATSDSEGVRQFRLSVTLDPDTEDRLAARKYNLTRRGHVILPSGDVIRSDFDVDGARQPGRRPTLHISWLEADPTIGEVDIDYRQFGWRDVFGLLGGHLDPDNSNVTWGYHYDLHVERYGPGLVQWWR